MQVFQSNTDLNNNPIDAVSSYKRSDKYMTVNTRQVHELLEKAHFEHISTSYGKPRKQEKQGFQKHISIFDTGYKVDDENMLRLLVTNSHDGSTALKFNVGIFRTVCANGLVVGNSAFEYSINHSNSNIRTLVNDNVEKIREQLPIVAETIKTMRETKVDNVKRVLLGHLVQDLRGLDRDNVFWVDNKELMKAKRLEDQGQDAYTIFNIGQESLIRGGFKYTIQSGNDQDNTLSFKDYTARKIKSKTRQVELNKVYWNQAVDYLLNDKVA